MFITLSNTGIVDSFGGVLLAVLAFNLLVLMTLTFAPRVHNKITDWIFDTFFNGSHNRHK